MLLQRRELLTGAFTLVSGAGLSGAALGVLSTSGISGSVSGLAGATGPETTGSRLEAASSIWPGSVRFIRTRGYWTAGDGGGALYKRVAEEPAHAGKFQSADGAWWELAEFEVSIDMLGAQGDGVADDWPALVAALGVLTERRKLIFNGAKTYRFLNGNGNDDLPDNILADHVEIDGNGATVIGDPGSGVLVDSTYNQHYFLFKATNRKGLRFHNINLKGVLSLASLYGCEDVRFNNCTDDGRMQLNTSRPLTITGIAQGDPGVLTYTGTDPADGEYFTLTRIGGMTELNERVVRVRELDTVAKTFMLRDADNVTLNTSGFRAYTGGGTATFATNWLRDKSIYLKECRDVVVESCRFRNFLFGVYCIGDQVSTKCHRVRVIGCHFEIDAVNYTALFPCGVYAVDVVDGVISACTFRNIYSSVRGGNTGTGVGYCVYEGDGAAISLTVTGCTAVFEASGGRTGAFAYCSELVSGVFSDITCRVDAGANVPFLVRVDAKTADSQILIDHLVADVAEGVDCYCIHVAGTPGNPRAPAVRIREATIRGGEHAVRIDFLGNGRFSIEAPEFVGQTSPAGAVYVIGTPDRPHNQFSVSGGSIRLSQGPGIHCASYVLNPRIHDVEILDGNLDGRAGDLGAAILLLGYSQGLDMRNCRVGNTRAGRGKFTYGVVNGVNPTDRTLKDVTADNSFIGLENDAHSRRLNH